VHTQFKCELTKIYAIFNNYLEIMLIQITKVASTCFELLGLYFYGYCLQSVSMNVRSTPLAMQN